MSTSEKLIISHNISKAVTFYMSVANSSSDFVVPVTNTTIVVSVPEGCVLKQISGFLGWINQENLVPKEVDIMINFVFSAVFVPLFFLASFCTNIVNMVVFYKHGLKERINMCLFSLSLLDISFVTVAFAFSSDVPYMYLAGKPGVGPVVVFFIRKFLACFYSFVWASQVVSSVIALERCLCITQPLLLKSLISTKKLAISLWSVVVIVVGGDFFADGMRLSVICIFDARDNSIEYQVFPKEFYFQNQLIMDIFSGIIYGLILPALCALCVTVCTVITVVKMKKLSAWRESVSSASDSLTARDLAVTRMIVGTSILFIICIVPSVLFRISVLFVPDLSLGGRYENLHAVFFRFFQLSSVINCTFNFFIYYFYGSKFRQTVRELFLPCLCHRKKNILKSPVPSAEGGHGISCQFHD